jgi:hypothetical protein
MFHVGRWAFGQTGAAQAHLAKNGVGVGDIFLFFGLFETSQPKERHHRIFGYMRVDAVRRVGSRPNASDQPEGFVRRHPHTIGEWNENNTIYLGVGSRAKKAPEILRLSKRDGPVSRWVVPSWLERSGLTYHSKQERWATRGELQVVARGQEFVANAEADGEAKSWLARIVEAIETGRG